MAKLNQMKHISVLNYNENYVCISVAPNKSIRLEPAEGNTPSLTPLTLDEIRYANNGNVFKTGMLEFQEDVKDELYEELRIDTEKVLTIGEIREILLTPTKNGLLKILSITSSSDFERVRGQFQKLKYEGHRLTLDVANIIERRTKELFANQTKTSIQIDDAVTVQQNSRVDELEKQLEEMKAMMAQMLQKNQVSTQEVNGTQGEQSEDKPSVQKGRPKKTTDK